MNNTIKSTYSKRSEVEKMTAKSKIVKDYTCSSRFVQDFKHRFLGALLKLMNKLKKNWKKVMTSKHETENAVIVAEEDQYSKKSAFKKLHCFFEVLQNRFLYFIFSRSYRQFRLSRFL